MEDQDSDSLTIGSYDSNLDRENNFGGPASIWLGYIRNERGLADALDQEQANDLSLHLYNAHAIKAMHYDRRHQHATKSWQAKQTWVRKTPNGKPIWTPPQVWTAWPMNAEDVPRPGERHGNLEALRYPDDQTWRKMESWYPSIDLEEEILALLLRESKTQLHAEVQKIERPHGIPTSSITSQPPDDSQVVHSEHPDKDEVLIKEEARLETGGQHSPTMQLIDDDKLAREILLPSIRHILSQFDDLLLALHKSRARNNPVRTQTIDDEAVWSKKRKRASTGGDRARKLMKSLNNESIDQHHEPARTKPQDGYLYTRDWSEVLGVATMAGLDQDVILRTTQRCAALFGETMTVEATSVTDVPLAVSAADNKIEYLLREDLDNQYKASGKSHTENSSYTAAVMAELSQFGRRR